MRPAFTLRYLCVATQPCRQRATSPPAARNLLSPGCNLVHDTTGVGEGFVDQHHRGGSAAVPVAFYAVTRTHALPQQACRDAGMERAALLTSGNARQLDHPGIENAADGTDIGGFERELDLPPVPPVSSAGRSRAENCGAKHYGAQSQVPGGQGELPPANVRPWRVGIRATIFETSCR